MCNETHGWYKDTWKSGNLAPTYGNLQSDVFTSWGPFDTPGSLWEAALMNAGRRRRDAPTHPSQNDDGYSSIAPVIPYTTEELERLQSGRSAHTLRAVSNILFRDILFSRDIIYIRDIKYIKDFTNFRDL